MVGRLGIYRNPGLEIVVRGVLRIPSYSLRTEIEQESLHDD